MLTSYYQLISYDSDQSFLRKTPMIRSRSFVEQFLKMHYTWMMVGTITITDIDNASQSISATDTSEVCINSTSGGRSVGSFFWYANTASATADTEDAGIVLGTGTTAVSPTQRALTTEIADGISASTLEYFPCGGTAVTTSGLTGSFTLERLFRNSSGGTITVNEIGIYSMIIERGFNTDRFCTVRDIVSPGFSIANNEYARAIYTISVTA